MVDWINLQAKAYEIQQKYGITQPPVNVFDIAANEGIKLMYFRPDGDVYEDVSGFLTRGSKTVYLNANETPERQAFTLAHELGHYFLDHRPDEYEVYRRESLYRDDKPLKEQEADAFAAELLMPITLINELKKKYQLSEKDTFILAKMFGVSRSAMAYRLRGLGLPE